VGTGSLRRAAQLQARRPDLEIAPLRGNVPTRLRKLASEELDAVVLACAGLERLGLAQRIDERLAPEIMLPAVGQGVLAVEARRDGELASAAGAISHRATAERVTAERAVLIRLGADCNVPLAAYAEHTSRGTLRLRALLAARNGLRVLRAEVEGPPAEAARLGVRAAEVILQSGGEALLAELRAEARE
jgi:hydroxymethylbilane synthase